MAAQLPKFLQVEAIGDGRYAVNHPTDDPESRNVVFAGQVLAQMLMVADDVANGEKDVKSIHAVFARAGTYSDPMELTVDTMHSGRAWASHTITATQNDRLMSRGIVLMNADEPDIIRHGPRMPDVPGPDGLESSTGGMGFPGVETRTVADPPPAPDGSPTNYFWMRSSETYGPLAANQAVLAWSQPGSLIGVAMAHHPDEVKISDAHRTISTGIIAHTAHFHERFDVSDWLLVGLQATYAGRGRVNGSGSVYTADGRLVSTFEQDSMVRAAQGSLDPSRSM